MMLLKAESLILMEFGGKTPPRPSGNKQAQSSHSCSCQPTLSFSPGIYALHPPSRSVPFYPAHLRLPFYGAALYLQGP